MPITVGDKKDEAFGVIEICNKKNNEFTDKDALLIQPIICLFSLILTYYGEYNNNIDHINEITMELSRAEEANNDLQQQHISFLFLFLF